MLAIHQIVRFEERAELFRQSPIVGVDQFGGAVKRDLGCAAQEIAKRAEILLILLQTVKLLHPMSNKIVKFCER